MHDPPDSSLARPGRDFAMFTKAREINTPPAMLSITTHFNNNGLMEGTGYLGLLHGSKLPQGLEDCLPYDPHISLSI